MDFLKRLRAAIADGAELPTFQGDLEYYRKDGSILWAELRVVPQVDSNGHFVQLLGVTRDISERKRFEEELARLAITDALTGVWNRRYGLELFTRARDEALRYNVPMTLLMLDLDHFKTVNDTNGHQAGDRVLVEITARISAHMRLTDVLARWGGEEFLVLLRHCRTKEAVEFAENIRQLVVSELIHEIGTITMSVGVAELHPDDTIDSWVHRADQAMYAAKASGRNAVIAAPLPT